MEVSALNGKAHPQEHRVHDPYAMTRRLWPCVGVSLGGRVDNFFPAYVERYPVPDGSSNNIALCSLRLEGTPA